MGIFLLHKKEFTISEFGRQGYNLWMSELVFLEEIQRIDSAKSIYKCLCGRIKKICRKDVRRGKIKSCGCYAQSAESIKKRIETKQKRRALGLYAPPPKRTPHALSAFNRIIRISKAKKNLNISAQFLFDLFNKQNGKCFFTHLDIIPIRDVIKSIYSHPIWKNASLDRINNDLGYIEGNVRYVARNINLAKNISTDQEIYNYIRIIKGTFNFSDIEKQDLSKLDFGCLFKTLFNSGRKNNFLKISDLYYLWDQQGGKCFYTGVPLRVKTHKDTLAKIQIPFNFQCSVDRTDSSKPYILDNCKLVSVTTNFAKHSLSEKDFLEFLNEIKMVEPKEIRTPCPSTTYE